MITRRDALTALGLATFGLAHPAIAHHSKTGAPDEEMVLGAADAPITMIEYSSLTCPHCAKFHKESLPQIQTDYIDTGKVRLIYRDFPLDSGALYAAALARCAGPERFFAFLEVLFRSQATWAGGEDARGGLSRIGRLGGLSDEEITACFNNKGLLDSVMTSRIDGSKMHDISSTPTFIINGEKVAGALSFAEFEEIFERMLTNT